ncbi:MAG: hypothetical protein ACYC6D_08000 [Melioribacteraceae bacterium]
MKRKEELTHIGIVWYTEEEWRKMKVISSDSEIFEDSFKEWEEMALKTLVDMKATGIVGTKVFIKSDEFIVWCKINSLPLNASSRSKYITEIMTKQNSN